MTRIVIVGAGMAGLRAAERLRELGHTGDLVVVGAEDSAPYHRPALSKQFLTGVLKAPDLAIEATDDLDLTWRLGTPVSQLDLSRRILHLPGGEELGYDGLIIATGLEARRLGGGYHGHPRVTTLRTLADGKRLQRALAGNRLPTVIIGSGFTSCEIASSMRAMGREVTIVGRSLHLMGNLLRRELGRELVDLHRRHGVDLQLGTSIAECSPGLRSVTVRLRNETVIQAAAVVVAVGSIAGVSWLRDAGLPLDDGVLCDPTCHVTGLDDVVAAGDVARWPNLWFDHQPRRVEHWTNAVEMGRAAAENLLAGRAKAEPFMPIPRFWSEQHGTHIQAAGMPALGEDLVTLRSTTSGGRAVTGYLRDDQLVGVVGFNSSAAVLAYSEQLGNQASGPSRRSATVRGTGRRLPFQQAVRASL